MSQNPVARQAGIRRVSTPRHFLNGSEFRGFPMVLTAESDNRLELPVTVLECPGHTAALLPGNLNRIATQLAEHRLTVRRGQLQTLHVNAGRKCSQACAQCHADAAPWRAEMRPANIAQRVGETIGRKITGMSPVQEAVRRSCGNQEGKSRPVVVTVNLPCFTPLAAIKASAICLMRAALPRTASTSRQL